MKSLVRNIAGFTLLAAGSLMIVLPGPGWVTIALGLALLAPDFAWARRALDRIKATGTKGAEYSRDRFREFRRRTRAKSD